MQEPVFPEYDDSIVNLSCSILNHYGINPPNKTLPVADEILSRNFKHVVVILLDGLGMNILEQYLNPQDFLRRNLLKDYSSVFPPTTTASVTSFLSGKTPAEHGWLGWDVYFEQEDKTVTCFLNEIMETKKNAAEYHVANKYLPYENIIDQINNKGTAKANAILPFANPEYRDINNWIKAIKQSTEKAGKTFTYAYFENPDILLHHSGTKSEEVNEVIKELNSKISILCEQMEDTVFFITADHGHTDIYNVYLQEDYPEIANMMIRQPSIEPRAISFFVKDKYKKDFPAVFNKFFENDYILFTKQEVLDKKLFGTGFLHENSTGIGDFIAAATGQKTILWNKNCKSFKSHHAGLTKDEMRIPLIWKVAKKNRSELFAYYLIVGIIAVWFIIAVI